MARQQAMHPHSLTTYAEERDRLSVRALAILDVFTLKGRMTDRQVARAMGVHRSYVPPRMSELVKAELLVEVGSTKDPTTRKMVRVCALPQAAPEKDQLALSLDHPAKHRCGPAAGPPPPGTKE